MLVLTRTVFVKLDSAGGGEADLRSADKGSRACRIKSRSPIPKLNFLRTNQELDIPIPAKGKFLDPYLIMPPS